MASAYALSGSNLLTFDTATPGSTRTVAMTGVTAGETLVAIDVRPQNGRLYALGVNAAANTATLYVVDTLTGKVTVVGTASSIALVDTGGNPIDLPDPASAGYGFDFNPLVDRIRVTAGDLNFRIDPNSGTAIDSDANAGNGVNPDTAINGGTTAVDAVAYTNNHASQNGGATTLYTLDANSDELFISPTPNNGTQASVVAVTLNGQPLDFTAINGFDIPAGVYDDVSGTGVDAGSGFAVLNVGGTTGLYAIDLVTGAATFLGGVSDGATSVQGFAVEIDHGGAQAIALTADGQNLILFNTVAPDFTSSVPVISGLLPGHVLVGVDFRPATGQLYGVAINAAGDLGSVYLLNITSTGVVATAVGAAFQFLDGSGAIIDLPDPATAGYGMDFNPDVDRIRITTSTGLNFRLNPETGDAIDGNFGDSSAVANVNPDGAINGSGVTGVSATAYTNSYGDDTSVTATTIYTLDAGSDQLFIQNPPNSGTQTSPLQITLGGNPLDFTDVAGFDIPARVRVADGNDPAVGYGYAVLTVAGTTSLYQIDLATGAATNLGTVGAGATLLAGFTLGDRNTFPTMLTGVAAAVEENTTAVLTVSVQNFDQDRITYSIDGGADAAHFTIDANTGALSFVSAPDFENPTDDGADNTYEVIVAASDGVFVSDRILTVTVTDAAEIPVITSNGGGDTASLDVAENTSAVTTVTATDTSGTNPFQIVGGADAAMFTIDSATGVLSFISAPDFEVRADADGNNTYVVQVRATSDGGSDDQTITVNVTDVDDAVSANGLSGDDSFTAPEGDARIDGGGGVDTVRFNFRLVDATVTYVGNQVIIASASSTTVVTGFEKYVFTDGTVDNWDENLLVDDLFYYSHNHDVWNAQADADSHYDIFGWMEGRDPNAFFDTTGYLAAYTDVAAAGVNPLGHYHVFGFEEGRDPSANFDTALYLAANPDVAAAGVDPLAHFLTYGHQEGRLPFSDGAFA